MRRKSFSAAEGCLDAPAALIADLTTVDRPGTFSIEAPAQRAGVTGLVGDQAATRPAGPSTGRPADIGDVACRQPQNSRALQQVWHGMDFGDLGTSRLPIACASHPASHHGRAGTFT